MSTIFFPFCSDFARIALFRLPSMLSYAYQLSRHVEIIPIPCSPSFLYYCASFYFYRSLGRSHFPCVAVSNQLLIEFSNTIKKSGTLFENTFSGNFSSNASKNNDKIISMPHTHTCAYRQTVPAIIFRFDNKKRQSKEIGYPQRYTH